MMIVDQGKVVEAAFEPGEFVYDSSAEPTIFAGSFGDSVCKMFANMAKRFTFGGEAPRTQRVYYFNTKELTGNKYGTASPVPFRVLDERAGIDMDIGLRCFGEYSYRIVNPMLFYTNVCGNMAEEYRRENLDSQLKSELLTALQPAFARIGANGVRYSALPAHTMEIADALNEQLSSKWRELRGIEIVSFGVNSVKADEEDEKTIKEMQREAAYRDPTRAAGSLVHAQAEAMKSAAANANAGPAMAFMGMNMAGQAGGASVQNLYAMGQQQAQAAGEWTCSCGQTGNTGKFCMGCGRPKPEQNSWKCVCGTVNTGKFCSECGKPRPENTAWTCSCGAVNQGKFCSECGKAKPNM